MLIKRLLSIVTLMIAVEVSAQEEIFVPTVTTIGNNSRIGDGLAVDSEGSIFIAAGNQMGFLWKVSPEGTFTEFATGLGYAVGVVIDNDDNIYVNDYQSGTMHKLLPDGTRNDFVTGLNGPAGLAKDSKGFIYVTEYGANFSGTGSSIVRISPDGTTSSFASGAPLKDTIGIAIDESDNVYVTNYVGSTVYKIAEGTSTPVEFATIPVEVSRINQITYSRGYVYVPSANTDQIYRIDMEGTVSLFAGTGGTGDLDGAALDSTFANPGTIGANASGDKIYVVDNETKRLREIKIPSYIGYEESGDSVTRFVNTGDWMGWWATQDAPWVYVYSLNTYAYLDEASHAEGGAWFYLYK